MSSTGAVLVEWCSTDGSDTIRVGQAWSASTEPNVSLDIIRSFESQSGQLRLKRPVWGSYATVVGRYDSDRLFAWGTVPGIEAIYYSHNEDTIFISNRPLPIACGRVRASVHEIELDEEYLRDYLSFGFPMSGNSPFSGVWSVPAGSAVSVYQGEFAIVEAPNSPTASLEPTPHDHSAGSAELTSALRLATQRRLESLGDRPIQLRLSGGKDSRLMLALLRDAGATKITAVTQGDASSQEVMVAKELAHLAGVEHQSVHARLANVAGVLDSVDQSIKDSQGLLLSEAIGMPYAFADPLQIGEGYAAGQWPTFKAPYVRSTAHTLSDLDIEWNAHIADNLSAELYEHASRSIRKWVASVSSIANNDILYLYGRNVRANSYMQASSIAIDKYSKVLFPFVDSQVTSVSDVLPDNARRSEIPLFLAMRELWPESLSVPLARGGRFRFERKGAVEGISGPDFGRRTQKPKPTDINVVNPDYLDQAADRELLDSPLSEGARRVLLSETWPSLREYLSSDFVGLLERLANSGSEHEALVSLKTRRRRILTRVSIWRLIAADAWLSKRWLD